jgi:hypothetical protein
MASRLESLHAQLGFLLENAQSLLADSAPSSTYGGYGAATGGAGGAYGYRRTGVSPSPLPVYSFLAMQVSDLINRGARYNGALINKVGGGE